jgi:peptidoglycan/xylan/chitin deacetylase (PgdA/CDA1 family)
MIKRLLAIVGLVFALMKIHRLAWPLLALSLAAGCFAGPVQAPASGSWALGGHPNLIVAPAAVATADAAAPLPASSPGLPPILEPTQPALTEIAAVEAPAIEAAGAAAVLPALPAEASPAPAGEPASRVPILEYHYSSFEMLPTVIMRPAWFQAQMQWLSQAGFHTLSSTELAGFVAGAQPAPARSVALTFDVGASHFDQYVDDIVPALRRYHLRAIFFVMPSQTRDTCAGQIACWPSLLRWRDEGLISIESHSFFHEDYATLSPERLAYDAARSKAAIEAKTGQPVLGLCYPFDSVTPAAFDLLAKAGYQFAVAGATRHDRSAQWNDRQPYALPRYYPYSGPATYPLIGGTHGLAFAQMMLHAAQ